MRFFSFLFMFVAPFAIAGGIPNEVSPNRIPPLIHYRADTLRRDLESRGFEVIQGAWKLFRIEDRKSTRLNSSH